MMRLARLVQFTLLVLSPSLARSEGWIIDKDGKKYVETPQWSRKSIKPYTKKTNLLDDLYNRVELGFLRPGRQFLQFKNK